MTAVKFDGYEPEYYAHTATKDSRHGDWSMGFINQKISLERFFKFISDDILEEIDFEDIAWKGKYDSPDMRGENCTCCGGKRFHDCDETIPGILLKGGPNPYNNPYRMVDGRHRIEKLISQRKTKGKFYVIEYKIWVKDFIK